MACDDCLRGPFCLFRKGIRPRQKDGRPRGWVRSFLLLITNLITSPRFIRHYWAVTSCANPIDDSSIIDYADFRVIFIIRIYDLQVIFIISIRILIVFIRVSAISGCEGEVCCMPSYTLSPASSKNRRVPADLWPVSLLRAPPPEGSTSGGP